MSFPACAGQLQQALGVFDRYFSDNFSVTLSQNSELDWVAEEGVSENEPANAAASGHHTSAQPDLQEPQAKDAFDELLDQLQSCEDSAAAKLQEAAGDNAAFGAQIQHAEPAQDTASSGFDMVESMPDVSMEELDAMLQSSNDLEQNVEEDAEYEAFLKVIMTILRSSNILYVPRRWCADCSRAISE